MVLKAKVADSILTAVDQDRVLTMEQECVRIPSFTYEEQECAAYFARVMGEIGLDVEMVDVEDPMGTGRRGRQPVGRLRGTGGWAKPDAKRAYGPPGTGGRVESRSVQRSLRGWKDLRSRRSR